MKKVTIDLCQLLDELQALDIASASTNELVEYQTQLEFIKAGAEASDDLPENAVSFISECLAYYDRILAEFERRGIRFCSLWDEIAKHPEIIVSALMSMPLLDLINTEDRLKEAVEEDALIKPLYDLVLEILSERLSRCPSC